MKKASLLLVVIALAATVFAQEAVTAAVLAQKVQKDTQVATQGTDTCQSTFSSGNGVSYMQFCTTQNGNISTFQSPSQNQLYHGAEGYGLCDATNGNVGYYDWGIYGDSENWQDATITQPNGPNTFPLTITRTSSDGTWTLKQVFTRNTTIPSLKITMTLKNNSGVTRQVYLERFADIDADGTSGSNRFDADQFGAWGHLDHGLMMRATTDVAISGGGIVAAGSMDPCHPTFKIIPYTGDGAVMYEWPFTAGKAIAPQASRTAIFEYRAF